MPGEGRPADEKGRQNMSDPPFLRRALPEFVLVVAGVLVALALEGWFANAQERRAESEYVADLLAEADANAEALAGVSSFRAEAEAELLRAERLLLGGEISPDSAAVFILALEAGGTFEVVPRITTSVFDDLESSGRLQYIRDPGLRRAVIDHYGRVDAALARLRRIQDGIDAGLSTLLSESLPPLLFHRPAPRNPLRVELSTDTGASEVLAAARSVAARTELRPRIWAELTTLRREQQILMRLEQILVEYCETLAAGS